LNLSRNQLTDMPKELRNLRRLKALILNDNLISDIHHLQYLTQLNTIGKNVDYIA
jgi:Leucine-rich repeat (LRR) protein